MDFAADTANDAQLAALAVGSQSLTPAFGSAVYSYTLTASAASAKIEATAVQPGAEIAIEYNGANVRNGGTVTWTADGAPHPLTVTVKQGNAVRVYTVQVTKAAA
ncbi:MAG TPA: cadherin-like beta sandwich domain-containing protein [Firmicutes bacterium]|nr:cadherin-like beta sandwich domain-containing protein [Bacillota bacterium]